MSVPNETLYNFYDPYNMIAGVSMILVRIGKVQVLYIFHVQVGLIGIPANYLVISIFVEYSSERTSFTTLGVTRATANILILIGLYAMIFIPTSFVGYTPFLPVPVTTLSITVGMAIYAINENQTLLTALNRFCALYFPFQYSKFFGIKPTILLLTILWIYRVGKVIVPLFSIELSKNVCWAYFSPNYLTWLITSPDTCGSSFDGTIMAALQIFGLTTVFNVATFSKVLYFYRHKSQSDAVSRRKERKNILLFFQTILQDFLYVIDFTFTFYFSTLIDHRMWTFLSGTLIWQSIHAIDGLIIILFSDRVSILKGCFTKRLPHSELQSLPHSDIKRHSISAALATIN
ncbi:hypothetical protein CRE_26979 [Caenorhabditis remanei]|uniref:G-protein coupled receptors family 1 profile domain-containing protein n=1 Tax=Caenorhabditis remanei TaxID=31234 RepID=E3LPL5_CAERE|nr:hypothetical protein CRE_26979 [Caenorhabditis remanei]